MKSPHHTSRSRLLCRVVRSWSTLAGDPTSGHVARHRAHCAACEEYFAASEALDARLRSAAPRQVQQPLPPGFEQRLERALAPVVRSPARAAASDTDTGSRWVLWSLFGSLTAAAALAFVMMRPAAVVPPAQQQQQHIVENTVPAQAPLTIDSAAGGALLELAQQDPLQREIDNVYADARGALRFLALNFLPESAIADAPSS